MSKDPPYIFALMTPGRPNTPDGVLGIHLSPLGTVPAVTSNEHNLRAMILIAKQAGGPFRVVRYEHPVDVTAEFS